MLFMSADSDEGPREGRIARHLRVAGELHRDPASAVPMARGWFVKLWQAKGGGVYGLGYIVTLIVLEVRTLTGDISESTGVASFFTSQLFGYLIRISIDSFFNLIIAAIWPLQFFMWLGPVSLLLLLGGYFAFARLLRPLAEQQFPELREAREAKAALALSEANEPARRRWWSLRRKNRS